MRPPATPLQLAWTYSPSRYVAELLADAANVYAIDLDYVPDAGTFPRTLVSLDAATGLVRWRTPMTERNGTSSGRRFSSTVAHGLFLDLDHGNIIDAYDVVTGHRRWRADLEAVLQPLLATSTSWCHQSSRANVVLARADGADLLVLVNGVLVNGDTTHACQVSGFRVKLDPGTGLPRSVMDLGSYLGWSGSGIPTDTQGNLFVHQSRSPLNLLASYDAMGNRRWERQIDQSSERRAVISGQLFGTDGAAVGSTWCWSLAVTGTANGLSQGTITPVPDWYSNFGDIVGRDGVGYFSGWARTASSPRCMTGPLMMHVVQARAGLVASIPLRTGTTWLSSLVLSAQGFALFTSTDESYKMSASFTSLTAVSRWGVEFQCPLPAMGVSFVDPVLVAGRWVGVDGAGGPVVAYEVPGLSASRSGWVAAGASFARDQVELP